MNCFGHLKAHLEYGGMPLADVDPLVAATALETRALLVSGNTKHFNRIEGQELVNWLE